MTVSMKRCLPWRNSCPPDFGAVIAEAAHELGHLADGVGPDGVVVEVTGHAAAPATCWVAQAYRAS